MGRRPKFKPFPTFRSPTPSKILSPSMSSTLASVRWYRGLYESLWSQPSFLKASCRPLLRCWSCSWGCGLRKSTLPLKCFSFTGKVTATGGLRSKWANRLRISPAAATSAGPCSTRRHRVTWRLEAVCQWGADEGRREMISSCSSWKQERIAGVLALKVMKCVGRFFGGRPLRFSSLSSTGADGFWFRFKAAR